MSGNIDSTVKIMTWNVKGLNSPQKRSSIMSEIRSNHSQIIFIQETHMTKKKIFSLSNSFFPYVYHSLSPIPKARGVSILIGSSMDWNYLDSYKDPEGRLLMVKGKFRDQMTTMVTFYAPNINQISFLEKTIEQISSFTEGLLILGGDLNVALNPTLDSSRGTSCLSYSFLKKINEALQEFDLIDVWRLVNNNDRDYTFFSTPFNTYSRIDYFFLRSTDLEYIENSNIGLSILSDHAPVFLQLRLRAKHLDPWNWQINNSLLQDEEYQTEIKKEIQFFLERHEGTDTPIIYQWEAMKCFLRGITIAYASKKKKQNDKAISELLKQINVVESKHKNKTTESTLSELQELKARLSTLLNLRQKARFLKSKAHLYEWSNKSGPVLAKLAAKPVKRYRIQGIDLGAGKITKNKQEIVNAFEKYYHSLYNLMPMEDSETRDRKINEINAFLHSSNTPKIPQDFSQKLEAPITINEWQEALRETKINRAPGPDGFTLQFYKTFSDSLADFFIKAFNSIGGTNGFPKDTLRAIINVIPKEGKDTSQCKNYRPISLLNADLKLFTKILANRLKPILPDIIHPDQTGFISGRIIKDNTMKALNAIFHVQMQKIEMMMLAIDAEKAFDRVNWTYLTQTLRFIGLGPRFLEWIAALYNNPTATVKVNGKLSASFALSNGTRQGCPLSAIIFVLTLEPFLSLIRSNNDITGIPLGQLQLKLAAYADDLLFFITNPRITTPNLMNAFERFQSLSGFKVNWSKSLAFNVSIPDQTFHDLLSALNPLKSSPYLEYLGIKITNSVSSMFQLNYTAFSTMVKESLDRWSKKHISWFGRVAVLKMNVIPKMIYLLQCLPIPIPNKFFIKLRDIFISFIWGKRKYHRLNRNLLMRSKLQGGLGVPDPLNYFKAIHLSRVMDWCSGTSSNKDWVRLEQAATDISLDVIPWIRNEKLVRQINHPFIIATLKVLKDRPILIDPNKITLMYPILGNPKFKIGCQDPFFKNLKSKGIFRLSHLLKLLNSLDTPYSDDRLSLNLSWWQLVQLRTMTSKLTNDLSFSPVLSDFETLCNKNDPIRHSISKIYTLLQNTNLKNELSKLKYIEKWQQDMGIVFSTDQLSRIMYFTHKFSVASSYQENNYKILTRWYWDPEKLHKVFKNVSNICWRCKSAKGTLFHIFWSCPSIQSFWRRVREIIQLITNVDLGDKPEIYLFNLSPIPMNQYKKSIIPYLLNAAKASIPLYWKQSIPPPISLWFRKINELREMEELIAFTSHSSAIFARLWQPWIVFSDSSLFPKYNN